MTFDIESPKDWTERETRLFVALADAFARIDQLEQRLLTAEIDAARRGVELDHVLDHVGLPTDPKADPAVESAIATVHSHAAVQSGVDRLKRIFPEIQFRTKH